jgi:hypothetical protein
MNNLENIKSEDEIRTLVLNNKIYVVNSNNLLHILVLNKQFELLLKTINVFSDQYFLHKNSDNKTAEQLAESLGYYKIYFLLKTKNPQLFTQKDVICEFYENLEKEGLHSDMILSIVDRVTNESVFYRSMSHTQTNGLNLVNEAFNQFNIHQHLIRKFKPLNFLVKFVLKYFYFIYFLFFSRVKKLKWKNHKKNIIENKQQDFNYVKFSEEETTKIKKYCKENKVLFFSYLLHSMNKTLQEEFLNKPEKKSQWLIFDSYNEFKIPYAMSYNDFSFVPIDVFSTDPSLIKNLKKTDFSIKISKICYKLFIVYWELVFFNLIYNFNLKKMLIPYLTGEVSRFAVFSYFGTINSDKYVLLGKTMTNPFSKINVTSMIQNKELFVGFEFHPSIMEGKCYNDILEKIRYNIINGTKTTNE